MKSVMLSLLFSLVVVTILADQVEFKDCGSQLGSIISVDVNPCPQFPCPFKRNTDVSLVMEFSATMNITSATSRVNGVIFGVPAPFPLPDPDACHSMSCPINAGDTVTYTNAVFVMPAYPKVPVVVQWELVTDSDVITCFTVPAQILD